MAKQKTETFDGVEVREIPGAPGYRVSRDGRVTGRSGKWLKLSFDGHYFACAPWDRAKKRNVPLRVHVAVALAWIGPKPSPKHEVLHGPAGKLCNDVSNLRWGTRRENNLDKRRDGTDHHASKTHCPQGHEYSEQNTYVQKGGGRVCKACLAPHRDDWLARNPDYKKSYADAYREANRAEINRRARQAHAANRDKRNARRRELHAEKRDAL